MDILKDTLISRHDIRHCLTARSLSSPRWRDCCGSVSLKASSLQKVSQSWPAMDFLGLVCFALCFARGPLVEMFLILRVLSKVDYDVTGNQ